MSARVSTYCQDEAIAWGKSDARSNQGFAYRSWFQNRHWTAHWSELWDTIERDGPIRPVGHAYVSEGGRIISFSEAVIDDFGDLVPVPLTIRSLE